MATNPGRVVAAAHRAAGAPPNVAVQRCEFGDLAKRIWSLFDFEISLERPYKLCDFRPAFGEIFADELAGYDFWGHSDLDLIFGQIREHLLGHGLRRRQDPVQRQLQPLPEHRRKLPAGTATRSARSATDALTNPAAMHFDEWAGIYYIVEDLGVHAGTRT